MDTTEKTETDSKEKALEGRCPRCGEILRFHGSETVCKLCERGRKEE
jgi:hypothetical protein